MSSFHKACFGGHLEVAKFLLTSGADLNCTDNVRKSIVIISAPIVMFCREDGVL